MRCCGIRNVLLLLLLAVPTAIADGGRIPIAGQTVITSPGDYVVTRDVTADSGVTITINADNVTLDLNGHELGQQNPNVAVVLIGGNNAIIRNGRISGGGRGIYYTGSVRIRLQVENVIIRGSRFGGVAIAAAEHIAVSSSRFENITNGPAIGVGGGSGAFTGRIVNNTITDCVTGISAYGIRGAELRGNVILNSYATTSAAIWIFSDPAWNAGGNLLIGNLIHGSGYIGIEVGGDSPDNTIEGNTVFSAGNTGIVVLSDGNDIRRNLCSGTTSRGITALGAHNRVRENHTTLNQDHGIAIGAQYQLVEDNLSEGNGGAGIAFSGSGHAHRGNMLRDNTGGAVTGGANSTDAGGNIQ